MVITKVYIHRIMYAAMRVASFELAIRESESQRVKKSDQMVLFKLTEL